MDTYQKKPALGEQNSKIIEKSQKYKGDEWCLWVSIKARAHGLHKEPVVDLSKVN